MSEEKTRLTTDEALEQIVWDDSINYNTRRTWRYKIRKGTMALATKLWILASNGYIPVVDIVWEKQNKKNSGKK